MDWPSKVPVMTLPGAILFPEAYLPLFIFEPRYRRMLEDVLHSHRLFAVALQRPGQTRECPAPVAGLGLVRASVQSPNGTSNLILQGLARVELTQVVRYRPYRVQKIRVLESPMPDHPALGALTSRLLELVSERLQSGVTPFPEPLATAFAGPKSVPNRAPQPGVQILSEVNSPAQIADLVSWTFLRDPLQRQAMLETLDVETRLRRLIHFLIAQTSPSEESPS